MKTLKATAINKHSDQDNRGLRRLDAKLIHIEADAPSIARLGKFLLACADEMRGKKPFHKHFRDFQRGWDPTLIDVVVERAVSSPEKQTNIRE
jgi:hypothetical protein